VGGRGGEAPPARESVTLTAREGAEPTPFFPSSPGPIKLEVAGAPDLGGLWVTMTFTARRRGYLTSTSGYYSSRLLAVNDSG
jgi:hypothetical protein